MVTTGMEYKVLGSRVLAVAKVGAVGDWAAYIGAVAGYNHEQEAIKVAEDGDKIHREFAEFLFPHWKHLQYRG